MKERCSLIIALSKYFCVSLTRTVILKKILKKTNCIRIEGLLTAHNSLDSSAVLSESCIMPWLVFPLLLSCLSQFAPLAVDLICHSTIFAFLAVFNA